MVSSGIAQKNSFEVVFVKLAPMVARALFDAHTLTKKLKVADIWLELVTPFVGSLLYNGVYHPIMQIDRVK